MKTLGAFALSLFILWVQPLGAQQTIHRVPEDFASIQAAVDAASPGDQIRVGPGQWCGATITKPLDLKGEGQPTITGFCGTPNLGVLRIGFFLPNADASSTTIRHFVFDGAGVSDVNTDPLAFAVFARDANNVVVEQNRILGTVQAISNTRGSGWTVSHNVIEDLTLFKCPGFCGGGVGIVFQQRTNADPRAIDNSATFNRITGSVPGNHDAYSMAGIFLLGQDGTVVKNNKIEIPDNPTALGAGEAILVSDICCGLGPSFLTTINSVIVNNDARNSEFAVVITLDSGGGAGNSVGTTLRGNFGTNDINDVSSQVTNRSIKTLIEFP